MPRAKHIVVSGVVHTVTPVSAIIEGLPRHGSDSFQGQSIPTSSFSHANRLQEEMTSALATMRVDYDQVKIKDLKTSNNRLLNKRRKKQAGSSSASQGCNNQ